jgi:hypothetical protein
MKIIDMTGQEYGHMKVLGFSHTEKSRAMWVCFCVCGVEKFVSGKLLREGKVVSCGCQRGAKRIYDDPVSRQKEWKALNKEKCRGYLKQYRDRNKEQLLEKGRVYSSLHRAKRVKRKAMPPWAEKESISLVYKKAKEYGWTVDHIVPLQSKLVCGLHVWRNLQLMDKPLNQSKSNLHWPDMP